MRESSKQINESLAFSLGEKLDPILNDHIDDASIIRNDSIKISSSEIGQTTLNNQQTVTPELNSPETNNHASEENQAPNALTSMNFSLVVHPLPDSSLNSVSHSNMMT